MSESPREAGEGGFGAPPGAGEWSTPGPAAPPPAPTAPTGYQQQPPPQGQPYPAYPGPGAPAYQQGYAQAYPPPYPAAYPGQPAYAGYVPAAPTSTFPVSTFVLLLVSVISLIATGILGTPSAIISVVAWRSNATDPALCRKRTTTGWVVYAVNFVLAVPLLIWFYVWALGNQ